MAKIAELTLQHEKEGRIKKPKKQIKNGDNDETMFEDLQGEDKEGQEENKTNNKRSKPVQKEYINKGKVDASKAANKRKAKEAKK